MSRIGKDQAPQATGARSYVFNSDQKSHQPSITLSSISTDNSYILKYRVLSYCEPVTSRKMPRLPSSHLARCSLRPISNQIDYRSAGYPTHFSTTMFLLPANLGVPTLTGSTRRLTSALLPRKELQRLAADTTVSNKSICQRLHNGSGGTAAVIIPVPGSPTASDVPSLSTLARLTPLPSSPPRRDISTPTTERRAALGCKVPSSISAAHLPVQVPHILQQISTKDGQSTTKPTARYMGYSKNW